MARIRAIVVCVVAFWVSMAACKTEVREKETYLGDLQIRVVLDRGQDVDVVFAKTTVTCKGGKSFVLSTGNTSGSCTIDKSGGEVRGGKCSDGANQSEAECASNDGEGACGTTTGSGECTVAK